MLYGSVDPAAVCDHRVLNHCIGADLMSGHTAVTAVDLPVFIKEVDTAVLRIQNLHIRLPKRGDRSNILPVTLKVVCIHLSADLFSRFGMILFPKSFSEFGICLILDQVLL